ncbi:hypothetical protein C0J52_28251 [Blattella germanica]|nr:hypothetical protein C0J52_28251 [Blattella germanica]
MASEVQDGISSWCTKEFLENALQQGKSNPDLRVDRYQIEKATSSGDNYLSDMFRINLKTNEEKETTSIIVKCSPIKEAVGKKRAIRIIHGAPPRTHCNPLFIKLGILTLPSM